MAIYTHMTTFAGRPVVDFSVEAIAAGAHLPDLSRVALALRGSDWDEFESEQLVRLCEALLATPGHIHLEALVLGWWGSVDVTSRAVVDWLTAHVDSFPNLRALFVGDMTMEENEISWINQCDLRPLLQALPRLEHLGTRGTGVQGIGNEVLHLGPIELPELRSLVVETGGMPRELLAEVLGSTFPKLDKLELWLGTADYGATVTMDDLEPLFVDPPFPITWLGLRNSDLTDAIAARIAAAPVVPRLRRLDLSMGTLTDVGAQALLDGQSLANLHIVDLHGNFLSDQMVAHLTQFGVINVQHQRQADEGHRYVAVGE